MKVVIILFILIFSISSWANNCLDGHIALDIQKATLFNEDFKNSESMMTSSKLGKHYSLLKLDSVYSSKDKVLSFYVNFNIGADMVAIPYNIAGYEVSLNNEVIHKEDFTRNCTTGSQYTLMPGDYVELIKVKNISANNTPQKLHIKVWGQ